MTMTQQNRLQATRSHMTSVFNESRIYGKQATQSVGPQINRAGNLVLDNELANPNEMLGSLAKHKFNLYSKLH